jgi:streptomycin 6-kinase
MGWSERLVHDAIGPELLQRYGLDRSLSLILVTPRFPTSRHVVGMVYPAASPDPRLAVKIPRRPGDNSGVRREAEVLRVLADAETGVNLAVPEVAALLERQGHLVLVETAVPGAPLDPLRVQEDPLSAVRAGLDFICRLPVTRSASSDDGDWFAEVVEAPLRRFEQYVPGALVDSDSLVGRTRRRLSRLQGARMSRVLEHGDLSHPNLFLDRDGSLKVIDWERSTADGLPGLDLVFFLQYLAESQASAYERADQLEVFRRTFVGTTAWGRRLLESHLAWRGLDPNLAPEVLLATWARTASTLVDRLLPDGARAVSSTELAATVAQDRDVALWRCALMSFDEERPRGSVRFG